MGHIKFKLKPKDEKKCAFEFQEYARKVIEEFKILPPRNQEIFKKSKNENAFLKSKVDFIKESGKIPAQCGGLLLTLINKQHNFVKNYLLDKFGEIQGNEIFFNQYMKLTTPNKKIYFNKIKKITKNK